MIRSESYGLEWIMAHRSRKGYEKINPPLAEKMIHALGLVELLAVNGLDFIFKGGTSLVLLIGETGRFSIDIDIITTTDRTEVENVLSKICDGKPFRNFILNEHRSYKPGVPKAHYSLLYNSSLADKEDHILLDILYDEHTYPVILELPVKTDWLSTDENIFPVKVPSIESITGDKLTAFAPNTTGILFGKEKELEIMKQLYDLGNLFDRVKEMGIVREAFERTVLKEIKYRDNTCTTEDVVNDIIETGLLIARRETNKSELHLSNFNEIRRGLLQFKAYSTKGFFRIEEAIIASAKSALLAAKIRRNNMEVLAPFDKSRNKSDFLIELPDYIYLNKLPAEPLYYWYQALTVG